MKEASNLSFLQLFLLVFCYVTMIIMVYRMRSFLNPSVIFGFVYSFFFFDLIADTSYFITSLFARF